jgi:hypothetical protein
MKKSIPMVHITNPERNIQRKAIIIMARQHSGETPGSFVME